MRTFSIEVLVRGPHFKMAEGFLLKVNPDDIALTDFTLHTIGVFLSRNSLDEVYVEFLEDLKSSDIKIRELDIDDLKILINES